uniref:Uncharacterized protein n=1 Tax=Aegilops tauschii subsp. strangulata TaxID=200361 RepID=A0A453SEP2_AEGTS
HSPLCLYHFEEFFGRMGSKMLLVTALLVGIASQSYATRSLDGNHLVLLIMRHA